MLKLINAAPNRLDALRRSTQASRGQMAVLTSGQNVTLFNLASGSFTTRLRYTVGSTAVCDLRLTYDNWHTPNSGGGGEVANANAVIYKVAIEYNGVTYPVYWPSGVRSLSIDAGASAETAPLAIELPAGANFYVRTYVSYTPGTYAASTYVAQDANGDGYNAGDVADSTGAVTTNSNGGGLVAPTVITGTPAALAPVVLVSGDSIAGGAVGDTVKNRGFIRAALTTQSTLSIAAASERASGVAPVAGHMRRFRYAALCTHAVVFYGVNDLGNGQAQATIQANLLLVWQQIAQRGLTVYGCTITPNTTSTDSWATVGNQTIADTTKNGRRVAINAWIRDGAPILNGAVAATGSSAAGTLRAGTTGHPLTGYFEIADAVESARDSGLFKAGYTGDGVHLNGTGVPAAAAAINPAVFAV